MKSTWIKRLIGGLSLTTALFVFQACYGTPQDFENDVLIEGQVTSKTTGEPIQGVKIAIDEYYQQTYSNEEGKFSFYTGLSDSLKISFQDIDSLQNGSFFEKDTVLTNIVSDTLYLNIALEEK